MVEEFRTFLHKRTGGKVGKDGSINNAGVGSGRSPGGGGKRKSTLGMGGTLFRSRRLKKNLGE